MENCELLIFILQRILKNLSQLLEFDINEGKVNREGATEILVYWQGPINGAGD